jgi:hypothetical protein
MINNLNLNLFMKMWNWAECVAQRKGTQTVVHYIDICVCMCVLYTFLGWHRFHKYEKLCANKSDGIKNHVLNSTLKKKIDKMQYLTSS